MQPQLSGKVGLLPGLFKGRLTRETRIGLAAGGLLLTVAGSVLGLKSFSNKPIAQAQASEPEPVAVAQAPQPNPVLPPPMVPASIYPTGNTYTPPATTDSALPQPVVPASIYPTGNTYTPPASTAPTAPPPAVDFDHLVIPVNNSDKTPPAPKEQPLEMKASGYGQGWNYTGNPESNVPPPTAPDHGTPSPTPGYTPKEPAALAQNDVPLTLPPIPTSTAPPRPKELAKSESKTKSAGTQFTSETPPLPAPDAVAWDLPAPDTASPLKTTQENQVAEPGKKVTLTLPDPGKPQPRKADSGREKQAEPKALVLVGAEDKKDEGKNAIPLLPAENKSPPGPDAVDPLTVPLITPSNVTPPAPAPAPLPPPEPTPPLKLETPPSPAPLPPPEATPPLKIEPKKPSSPTIEPKKIVPAPMEFNPVIPGTVEKEPLKSPEPGKIRVETPAITIEPAAPQPSAPKIMEKPGDYTEDLYKGPQQTYAQISKQYYNSEAFASALEQYNKSSRKSASDPIRIPPIYVLQEQYASLIGTSSKAVTPASGLSSPVSVEAPVRPAAPVDDKVYIVETNNETLLSIARKKLGDRNAWERIANLNPQIDPDAPVAKGTRLQMP